MRERERERQREVRFISFFFFWIGDRVRSDLLISINNQMRRMIFLVKLISYFSFRKWIWNNNTFLSPKQPQLTNQMNKNSSEIQPSICRLIWYLLHKLVAVGLKQSILHNPTDLTMSPKLPPQHNSNSEENQILNIYAIMHATLDKLCFKKEA